MGGVRLSPVIVLLFLAACSDEGMIEFQDKEVCLERRDGARYCIEVYEASRRDATETEPGDDITSNPRSLEKRVPWVDVTWEGAKTACERKGKRLCERDEWIDACDGTIGEAGRVYTYGDVLDATRCNVGTMASVAGGSKEQCVALIGTFDQSGNVWEWTGNSAVVAAARGGGYRQDIGHECTAGDGMVVRDPDSPSPEFGFRCCRD